MKYKVFIDMDGVLLDFIKQWNKFDPNDPSGYNKEEIDALKEEYFQQEFFLNMELMSDARELINFVKENYEFEILTSVGIIHQEKVIEEKLKSLYKYFGQDIADKMIHTTKSKDKAVYANENTILIDDRLKSIDPFLAAGGAAIHHFNAQDTIKILKDNY